jgi:hypothetical protein
MAKERNQGMSEPVPSLTAFFEQLEREIRRCDTDVREMIIENLDFYCSDKALLAAVDGKRSALADFVAEIVRNKLMEHDLSMMAALDAATEMSDDVVRHLRDKSGTEWPTDLHARLMDYLMDRGLQSWRDREATREQMNAERSGRRGYEMTTKRIVVLANSIKKRGRCVAGREIIQKDREPGSWLRPISAVEEGTLMPNHMAVDSGRPLQVLDIVEVPVTQHARDLCHP